MTISMTAFGRMEDSGSWGRAVWEIKTVNHRYLDMSIRLPDDLRALENSVRERISARLKRGKVDCLLRYEPDGNDLSEVSLNIELANKLIAAAESLEIPGSAPVNPLEILRWPGVLNKETPDPEVLGGPLLDLLDKTLDLIIDTRKREGNKIREMILERCTSASDHVDQIRENLPDILASIRERILARAQELSSDLDHDRLEQEMLILTQKMDIAEEIDRLTAHIEEVRRVLNEDSPAGRRLDFLMQEMNREANTIGSKASNILLSKISVELKVLIEQMREQIQNIE